MSEKPGKSEQPATPVKAVALVSGGLDSTLAAKMIKDQGIEVHGVNFYTGFCITEHKRRVGTPTRNKDQARALRNEALRAGADTRIPVEMIDISNDYIKLVTHPKHGYGANANPCIDCRAFMLRKAKEHMEKIGASFVITGEVLGQRPMSQRRDPMRVIEKESGLQGLIVRPLTAKNVPESIPEKEGWVDREKLGGIQGRGRRTQMQMAEDLHLADYPQPAGGCCFLADETYARRFHEMLAHRTARELTHEDIVLLGVGRHFRISKDVKIVVGRDSIENEVLERYLGKRWACRAADVVGPTTLIEGMPGDAGVRQTIAGITARYSDGRTEPEVAVCFFTKMQDVAAYPPLTVPPLLDEAVLNDLRI